jgi:hypothetical protein
MAHVSTVWVDTWPLLYLEQLEGGSWNPQKVRSDFAAHTGKVQTAGTPFRHLSLCLCDLYR